MRLLPALIACIMCLSAAPVAAATPEIIDATVTPDHLRPGSSFVMMIHTTPDVVTVQGSVLKFHFDVPKTGPGEFSASGRVPWWARLFHGSFKIDFSAVNATGDRADAKAPVGI